MNDLIRIQPAIAGFEDRGRDHNSRNAGNLKKLEKTRKWILLQSLKRNVVLLTHFSLAGRTVKWIRRHQSGYYLIICKPGRRTSVEIKVNVEKKKTKKP